MVFEGVDLAPDDTAQMKRIKARVAIEETTRAMMAKGAGSPRRCCCTRSAMLEVSADELAANRYRVHGRARHSRQERKL